MKTLGAFLIALATVSALESCYKDVDQACEKSGSISHGTVVNGKLIPCNATYGNVDIVMKHLISFANSHIVKSFEYLMMSTHYGNYMKNRPGFEKLFRSLSDSKWEGAIDIIKHVTKRGGVMKFLPPSTVENDVKNTNTSKVYELYEIQSIAKALDMEKQLALEAFSVHKEADMKSEGKHDPEVASYIEKEFVHEHAKTIRKLAGYVADLNSMLSGPDGSLSLFLFDEYLQKE